MRSRSVRQTLLIDLAALFALAATLEVVLRVAAPIYGRQLFDNEYTGSFPMQMNAEGYRGQLVPKDKQPGELRILALGDFITFGTGVPAEKAWPAQLGEQLHASTGRPVVAMNGGVEGSSLEDFIYAWDRQWASYHPDVVVLAMTGNLLPFEVIAGTKRFLPAERFAAYHPALSRLQEIKLELNRDLHLFCVPSMVSIETQRLLYWQGLLNHNVEPRAPYGVLLAHGWRQGDLDPAVPGTAWERLATSIGQLAQRVDASGARLVLTYIAPRFTLTSDASDNQKNVPVERFSIDPVERSRQLAADLGIRYVDARAALIAGRQRIEAEEHRPAPMYIFFDYSHPNEDGHRAIAQALAGAM